jgi:dihydrofolate reductase
MISIIVVVGKNREIGYKNELLWALPKDMARFKKVTIGCPVLMGQKTFESIGKPLSGRKNIVVTLDRNFKLEDCEVRYSLDDVLKEYKNKKEEVFVIGGGQIYKQSLPYADKLYITEVDDSPEADVYFPDYSEFKKIVFEEEIEDNGHKIKFLELTK